MLDKDAIQDDHGHIVFAWPNIKAASSRRTPKEAPKQVPTEVKCALVPALLLLRDVSACGPSMEPSGPDGSGSSSSSSSSDRKGRETQCSGDRGRRRGRARRERSKARRVRPNPTSGRVRVGGLTAAWPASPVRDRGQRWSASCHRACGQFLRRGPHRSRAG